MKNIKNLPKEAGIYLITNNINQHQYVGQSINIYKRFNSHHIYDYKNSNSPTYNYSIYQAFRKYGIENFTVKILELCKKEELDEKEIFYIEKYNTFNNGYNETKGGQFWPDNIHSKEIEDKKRQTREKNKSLQAENHPRAKLTNEQVISIRQRYIDGETSASIWEDYKELYPSYDVFKRIILGKTYVSVGNIPNSEQVRHTNAKLTEKQVKEIRFRYSNEKISFSKLAKEYNVSATTISRIIKGLIYKNVN